jgi:DNA-binding protein HU-beta
VNKQEFVDELAMRLSTTKTDAKVIVETVTDIINQYVEEGVRLPDLGSWKVVTRKARNGVNPKTGAKIVIPEKQVVKHKSSIKL